MATYKTLATRLMSEAPSKILVTECAEFARSKKLDTLETFFTAQTLTNPVLEQAWLTFINDNAEELADVLNPPKAVSKHDLDNMYSEVYNRSFITVAPADNPDTLHSFKIADRDLREVVRLGTFKDDADTKAILAREIQKTLKQNDDLRLNEWMRKNDVVMDGTFAKRIREQAFINDTVDRSEMPKIFAQPHEDCFCLNRRTVIEKEGEFPYTKSLLSRVNDRKALAAWAYGIATGRYKGRQVVYLQGKGADGKGTFFKAFGEGVFKNSFKSFQSGNLKNAAGSFLIGMLEDARFALVPDSNDPAILLREDYKSLTSKDQVLINKKNQKMYTGYLETECAILSNFDPIIKPDRHSTSRILYLRIEPLPDNTPLDANFLEYYKSELPAFLHYAKQCYEEVCANDTEIRLNEAAQSCVDDIIEQGNEEFIRVYDRLFECCNGATISATDFNEALTDERFTKHQIDDFRRWLKEHFGVETYKGSKGARRYRGIQRKGSGSVEASILDD